MVMIGEETLLRVRNPMFATPIVITGPNFYFFARRQAEEVGVEAMSLVRLYPPRDKLDHIAKIARREGAPRLVPFASLRGLSRIDGTKKNRDFLV